MIAEGWVDEVRRLLARGYPASLKPLQSLGYRHIIRCLDGRQDLSAAVAAIKGDTRRYAKRQMTWFGADPEMIWFRPEDRDGVVNAVAAFLSGSESRPFA
jgi:tRNA dimethylallyltransferase